MYWTKPKRITITRNNQSKPHNEANHLLEYHKIKWMFNSFYKNIIKQSYLSLK